jgi:hypothetical protein
VVALCECVAAAKARYPSTKAFGAWWDAQGFEMNHQTRAALVAMGQDMTRAREVLAATERRSIEQVYLNDFRRLTDARKSPKEPPAPKVKKPEDAIAQSNRVAEIADALLADFSDSVPRTSARR